MRTGRQRFPESSGTRRALLGLGYLSPDLEQGDVEVVMAREEWPGQGAVIVMRQLLSALLVVPAVMWGTAASAQDQARDFSPDSARVYRASDGESLTPPSGGSAFDVVTGFLRGQGRSDATANSLVVESSSTDSRSGVTHTRLRQQVAGMTVYGTYVRASATADGRLVSVAENLAPITPAALVLAQITQAEALVAVLAEWYPTFTETLPEVSTIGNTTEFDGGTFFFKNPTVTRVVVPMANGALHGGYLVTTWDDDDNMLRHTVVGRTGRILAVQDRTSAHSYFIYDPHPEASTEQLAVGSDVWVDSATTSGPNVIAYLDSENDDTLDTGEQPPLTGTTQFHYSVDFSQDPEAFDANFDNRFAAVVNLFYQNNILHDVLNGHGFTPGFGNFEGDDPVLAEAQDGGGMNNANFATPSVGSPRMQMYLWDITPTALEQRRDGSLDKDIIAHEYGHGVTWRMVGDMSGVFGGASGEGFSDVLATWLTDEDRVAEYSSGWADGIRSTGYGSHTGTYGDFSGASVHSDGEIYAATMWDLREAWMDPSRNWVESELLDVTISGLAQTRTLPQPAFEDMRNGLLDAIEATGWTDWVDRQCLVWETYAARGIGEGANGEVRPRGKRFYTIKITESYAVPSSCSGGNTAPTVSITAPTVFTFDDGDTITFAATATDSEDGDLSGSVVWESSLDGELFTGASFATSTLKVGTHTITASVNDSGGLEDSDWVTVTVQPVGGGGFTLSANGYKVKGTMHVDLSWGGASGANIDVYRDGVLLPNMPTLNNGSYTDNTGAKAKGGRSYIYQVCEEATSTCSNSVTVDF